MQQQQNRYTNNDATYQQLLNSSTGNIPPEANISNRLPELEGHHSTDNLQQLQNQIHDLQKYIYLRKQMDEMRLRREQQRKQEQKDQQQETVKTQISARKRNISSHAVSDNDEDNHRRQKKMKKKKKTTHIHVPTQSEKGDEEQTIKRRTSSPRLKSAMKRFNAQFNMFTQTCMKEAGYTQQECMELLSTFQNEVIRECMHRKR